MSAEKKVVLITGAARGIGRAMLQGFLHDGYRVVAADISWSFVEPTADDLAFDDLTRDHPDVRRAVMDVSVDSHVKRVYALTMREFGTVDVIINNGGTRARDLYPDTSGLITVLETEIGDWQRMFDTHVFGALRVIKTFVKPMLEKKRGSIINVGSIGPLYYVGVTREGPYQPAKAAMHNMTMYLANELKVSNIAANVLCPGNTRTTGSDQQMALRLDAGVIPPPRLTPESCVPLALFYARQDASGTTGCIEDVMVWNEANGFGGWDVWTYEKPRADAQGSSVSAPSAVAR